MNSTVSFAGKIRISDYSKHIEKSFNTSKAQDKLIVEAAKELAPLESLTVLTNDQVNVFHKLLEKITNIKISNIKNEKGFYRTNNNISYGDRFIRPFAGMKIDISL